MGENSIHYSFASEVTELAAATAALERANGSYRLFLQLTSPPEDQAKKDKKKGPAAKGGKKKAEEHVHNEEVAEKDKIGGSEEVLTEKLNLFKSEYPEFTPRETTQEELDKMRDKLDTLHNVGQIDHKLPDAIVQGYAQMGNFLREAVASRTERCEVASKTLRDYADKIAATRSALVALQTEVIAEGPPLFNQIVDDFEQEADEVTHHRNDEVKWWFWSLLDFARSCRATVAKMLVNSQYAA